MIEFPTYARILRQGYELASDYGVVRTEMDNGIAKQRPTRSIPVVTHTVSIFVKTCEDQVEFMEWVTADLDGGVNWFEFKNPISKNVNQGRFVNGSIRWSPLARGWVGQADIEVIGY